MPRCCTAPLNGTIRGGATLRPWRAVMNIPPTGTLNLLAALNGGAGGASIGGFSVAGFADAEASVGFGPAGSVEVGGAADAAILGPLVAAYSQPPAVPAQSPRDQKREAQAIGAALAAVDENRLTDARDLLDDVLTRNRQSAGAYAAYGEVELRARNYAAAEAHLLRAASIDPASAYGERAADARELRQEDDAVVRRARQLLKSPDNRAKGIRLLAAVTDRSPGHVAARLELAEGQLSDGNAAGSLLQYQLAMSAADPAQLAQMERRLAELTEVAPRAVFVRRLLAETQLNLGRNQAARVTLAAAASLAEDPAALDDLQARVAVGLGRESLQYGDTTGALEQFQRAARLDPNAKYIDAALGEAYLLRGEQRARLGQRSAAVEDFRLAGRRLPADEPDLRDRSARGAYAVGAALKRRRSRDAGSAGAEVVALQAAVDIDPGNLRYRRELADSRFTLGDEFTAEGKLKDAAFAYQRAWQLQRGNSTYRSTAIAAFGRYGDDRLAHEDFDTAIQAYLDGYKVDQRSTPARQKLASGYNARGEHYLAQGEYDRALADFREAVKHDPQSDAYRANLDAARGQAE